MTGGIIYVKDGLTKRGESSWRVSYHAVLPDGTKGERKFSTLRGVSSRRDALVEAERFLSGLNAQTACCDRTPSLDDVGREIAESLFASRAIEESTYVDMLSILRLLSPISSAPIASIEKQDIIGFVSDLTDEGYSPVTVNAALKLLKRCFVWALDEGTIASDPAARVRGPKLTTAKPRSLSDEERHRLVAVLERSSGTVALAAFMALGTGMRRGEVCGLVWKDVDLELRKVHVSRSIATGIQGRQYVKPPKTASSDRTLPLEPRLVRLLEERRRAHVDMCRRAHVSFREDLYVLGDVDGDFMSPHDLGSRFADLCRSFGIARGECRFHWLRHTFASGMIAAGVDVRTVAAWLGHSDPGFTLRTYVDLNENAMDASVGSVANLLDTPRGYAESIGLAPLEGVATSDAAPSPGLGLVSMALPCCSSCGNARRVASLLETLFGSAASA